MFSKKQEILKLINTMTTQNTEMKHGTALEIAFNGVWQEMKTLQTKNSALLEACKLAYDHFQDDHGEFRNGVWHENRRVIQSLFDAIQSATQEKGQAV